MSTTEQYITIMEHQDLIQEMPRVEQMPTQERLLLARKRRNQQLQQWIQKEKEYGRKSSKQKTNKRGIFFNETVVLLEAAARNDIDEGNWYTRCLLIGKLINIGLFRAL